MANTASAKKYIRVTKKKTLLNDNYRRKYREIIKKIVDLLNDNKKSAAEKLLPLAQKAIDKAIKKGVLKKNTGARKKANLVKKILNTKK